MINYIEFTDIQQIFSEKLQNNWVKYDSKNKCPYFSNWQPSIQEKPDVVINSPENSTILEIKASEMNLNSLRFPRIEKVRYDKNWYECLSLQDFQMQLQGNNKFLMKNTNKINLNKSLDSLDEYQNQSGINLNIESDNSSYNSQSQSYNSSDQETQIINENSQNMTYCDESSRLQKFNQHDQLKISKLEIQYQHIKNKNIFKGMKFYIANLEKDDKQYRNDLEKLIQIFSGQIIKNHIFNCITIASKKDYAVQTIIKRSQQNIVYPNWIFDSLESNKLLDFAPKYLLSSSPQQQIQNDDKYDEYGDTYDELIDYKQLQDVFSNIQLKNNQLIENKTKYLQKINYFIIKPLWNKLFFKHESNIINQQMLSIQISRLGGSFTTELITNIDYIIQEAQSDLEYQSIKNYLNQNKQCTMINIQQFMNMCKQ